MEALRPAARFLPCLIGCALVLVACSPDRAPDPSASLSNPPPLASPSPAAPTPVPTPMSPPSSSPSPATGIAALAYGCSGGPTFHLSLLGEPGSAELEANASAVALRGAIAAARPEMGPLPSAGWWLVERTETTAYYLAPNQAEMRYAFVSLQFDQGTWRTVDSGSCVPRVAILGAGPAEVQLDPAAPAPAAGDTSIRLLATELKCNSGEPIGDRLLPPLVEARGREILVVVAVTPRPGDHDCQGNPSLSITIELPGPLGDRMLTDAGLLPYRPIAVP